jgi:Laminin G domain.
MRGEYAEGSRQVNRHIVSFKAVVEIVCCSESMSVCGFRCAIFTETCHRFLDLTGPLQIGGLPSLPTNFQVHTKDFVGCISDLYIDYKFIDLNR